MNTQNEQTHQAMDAIIEVAQKLLASTHDQEIEYGLNLIVSIARHKVDNRSSQDIERYKPE